MPHDCYGIATWQVGGADLDDPKDLWRRFVASNWFGAAITAGMVLVGSINGGQASNLCAYIAKGDVALSVLVTMLAASAHVPSSPYFAPTLITLACYILSLPAAIAMLLVLIISQGLVDILAARQNKLVGWYAPLRLLLSGVAGAALVSTLAYLATQ